MQTINDDDDDLAPFNLNPDASQTLPDVRTVVVYRSLIKLPSGL